MHMQGEVHVCRVIYRRAGVGACGAQARQGGGRQRARLYSRAGGCTAARSYILLDSSALRCILAPTTLPHPPHESIILHASCLDACPALLAPLAMQETQTKPEGQIREYGVLLLLPLLLLLLLGRVASFMSMSAQSRSVILCVVK